MASPLSLPRVPFPSTPKSIAKSRNPLQFSTTHLLKPFDSPQNPLHAFRKHLYHKMSSLCKDGLLDEAFDLLADMELEDQPIRPEIYGELLQGCVYERALPQGQQIHAMVLKKGAFFHKNEYLETKLVIFYAKCDIVAASASLFARQSCPNVFSWAAMIGLYSRKGLNLRALTSFVDMMEDGFIPDNFVVPNALKASSALQMVRFGQGVHGYAIKMAFGSNCVFVMSSLVDFYGKCGVLEDARKVFHEMPERNVVAWNSMLVGYVQNGLDEEAIEIFRDMRGEDVHPTRATVASFLSASANLEAFNEGRQGHAVAVLIGLEMDNILGSSIINFYSKLGLVEDAELAFDQLVERDMVTWNLLLSDYVMHGQMEEALFTCYRMREENLRFDLVTLTLIFLACADLGNVELGRVAHGYCFRNNLETDSLVAINLVEFYSKCGRMNHARQVFDTAMQHDVALWNTLISAYAQCGMSGEALKLFYQMQLEGVPLTVASWNSVISGFVKNGLVDEAHDMFLQMQSTGQQANIITWTTLITGFAQNGHGYEAVMLFEQMQAAGIAPNTSTFVGILLACTNLGSLKQGKVVHGYLTRQQLSTSPSIATSLVEMYARCGSINLAKKAFELVPDKEKPLYNVMIKGLASCGHAGEALAL